MKKPKCKICRRAHAKIFLKGEKCLSAKCPMVTKPYPPGPQSKNKRRRFLSEYGLQLREKQKLKNWYNIKERKLKKYVQEALKKRRRGIDAQTILIQSLEKRLDNTVFRLGLASSRTQARQLVNHGHFLVNTIKVNIPSYEVKKGDIVCLRESSRNKKYFEDLILKLNKSGIPAWLKLDEKKLVGTVMAEPVLEEVAAPAKISHIFEWYSR